MLQTTTKRILQNHIQEILARADIETNGDRPWDLQLHNQNFYQKVMNSGSLG